MVMPSHAESLPYVILEAAAAAQPLLATRVGGIPEIFGPQGDALIAPADAALLADGHPPKLAEPDETTVNESRSPAAIRQGPVRLGGHGRRRSGRLRRGARPPGGGTRQGRGGLDHAAGAVYRIALKLP